MTDPTVKETMLSLANLYRNLAKQIEELARISHEG